MTLKKKLIDEICCNFKKAVINKNEVAIEKEKFLAFDYTEKTPFDKQILQFAKKLRDDNVLNSKLSNTEKADLKNAVRVCYDFVTKNKDLKTEFNAKLQVLEDTVNLVVGSK